MMALSVSSAVGKGGAEHHHDGVADKFTEDAFVLENHLNHLGKILVLHRQRVAGTEFFGDRRKARDVREQYRCLLQRAAARVLTGFHQLFGDLFGDEARHRALDPLFVGDVLKGQYDADDCIFTVAQGYDGQIDLSAVAVL